MFVNHPNFLKNVNQYFLVIGYKVNEMIIALHLKLFYAILYSLPLVFDLLEKMSTFLNH